MPQPPTITQANPPLPLPELVGGIETFFQKEYWAQCEFISRLVSVHPFVNFQVGQIRYCRARKIEPGFRAKSVDEVIWRKDIPAALGRANPSGVPVLYLADRFETALSEIRITDSAVMLAGFETKPGHSVRMCPIGEMTQVYRTRNSSLIGEASESLYNVIVACAQKGEMDNLLAMLITDSFLLECLCRQDDYRISSHVAKCVFDKLPGVSVIGFPSRRQNSAFNFAIRTEDFWSDWGIRYVMNVRARHLAQGFFNIEDGEYVSRIADDGVLIWPKARHPSSESDPKFSRLWSTT